MPNITVKSLGPNLTSIRLGLLSGDCNTLTCLVNSSTYTLDYSGLTVGNYYYLKVGGSTGLNRENFICIAPRITNDECAGAITLPVKPYNKIKTTVWNVDGATSSMPTCNGQVDEDVWFKFIATDTACVITADGETAYPNFQVLSGSCGTLTSVHCSNVSILPNGTYMRTEKVRGLIPGNEYFVRYLPSNGGGFFSLDINSLPSNDDCVGATTLIPKSGLTYEQTYNNGILEASPSMAPCVASNYENDIWYKFTATSTTAAIISNGASITSVLAFLGFQVFEGSCTTLNPIICFEQGTPMHKAQPLSGLTPGQTYYIRQYGNIKYNTISVVNPPVNDNISGAIKLTPAPTGIQVTQSYYLHGASKTFGKICTSSSNAVYHDVWFYFIANASSHTVTANFSNYFWDEPMTGYSYRLEAFSGYAEDSATLVTKLINCAANTLAVGGLTAGDTVYVRVSNTSQENNTSIFSLTVTSPQSINEPAGALTLVKTDSYQYSLTTAGATQSLPAMGCSVADFPDDDIWLKFTAAADARRVIAGFEDKDVTIQLFSGAPGNLTHVMCSNNIMVLPDNLVTGEDYYLRLYSKLSATTAQFQIGLYGEGSFEMSDCIGTSCIGPNLVANPGIENQSEYLIPENNQGLAYTVRKLSEGWYNSSSATPDVWDADYPALKWANIPGNSPGRPEIPRSGKGMLGLLNGISIDWHEYVSGKLTEPMVQGKTYVVSFYVKVAEISHDKSMPLIGAYFSNDSVIGTYTSAFEITPHISNTPGEPIDNLTEWRKVCGIFYADKAYTFITLGSFREATIFNTTNSNYTYIDDVLVAEIFDCAVLPLKLLNFRGRTNDQNQSVLNWETEDEINLSRFEVEWRTDGTSFTKIGTVQATGNGSSISNYEFLHLSPDETNNYYRLKMIDIDDEFTYSSIVRLSKNSNGNGLSAYPNPVTSMLYLNAQADRDELVFFSIIQMDGRVVSKKQVIIKKGSNAFNWDMGNLAAGIYFIRSTSSAMGTIKIIKQ
jgi:hypothetical protein